MWGHKGRAGWDGVTTDSDYTCPKCEYLGPLLLRADERQSNVYWVPTGRWHNDGGAMVCPVCGNTFHLSRRKYRTLDKVVDGPGRLTTLDGVADAAERHTGRSGTTAGSVEATSRAAIAGGARDLVGDRGSSVEAGDADGQLPPPGWWWDGTKWNPPGQVASTEPPDR